MIFLIGLTIIIFLISFPTNAGARGGGGFLCFGFGEYISPVIDLPDSEYEKMDIGYKYFSIKIFFIPIMAFDGKFVLYKGDRYRELTEWEIIVFEAEYGSLYSEVNLWIRYVNWLWLIILIIVIGLYLIDPLIAELKKIRRQQEMPEIPLRKEPLREEPLRKECTICGKIDLLHFKCSYCGKIYCSAHRLPENHNCSFFKLKQEMPEKPLREEPLGKECTICGKIELLPFKCSYCGKIYCSAHRLPENHNCSFFKLK